ncbi:MAG: response regulator [Anaerolineae bacterium]|nr:response regulator [Anaerolineae bacterium]
MPTWMIVEDEPDIYEVLLAMFEMRGVDGLVFVDGEEALAWIDDIDSGLFYGPLPELALVNIHLPGMVDGLAVAARLRQSALLGEMPIVLSTASWMTPRQAAQAVKETGADELLFKPYYELQRQLEKVIASRQSIKLPQTMTNQVEMPVRDNVTGKNHIRNPLDSSSDR